jgi:hypothetical protein
MSNKVVAVVPTRGLVYAKTMQGFLTNVYENNAEPLIVDEKPMPDCFNSGVEQALERGAEYIWFLEEDNEAPPGVLKEMLRLQKPIVTLDYNVGGGVSHIHRDEGGKPLWCGLGCTLIRREVFERIEKPWFEVHRHFNQDGKEIIIPKEVLGKKYGGHDVLFFNVKCREAGFDITVLEGKKGQHYRAKEIEKREMNNGMYTITTI